MRETNPSNDRRRPPSRHPQPPKEPWYLRFRGGSSNRPGGLAFFGIGAKNAAYIESMGDTVLPEPDEELPESDLPDAERKDAIARERWRRQHNPLED
jgi:hypothetical protein